MAEEQEVKVKAPKILNTAEIKKIAKASGKRVSVDFLQAWDRYTRKQLDACVAYHNAGAKTLKGETLAYVTGGK